MRQLLGASAGRPANRVSRTDFPSRGAHIDVDRCGYLRRRAARVLVLRSRTMVWSRRERKVGSERDHEREHARPRHSDGPPVAFAVRMRSQAAQLSDHPRTQPRSDVEESALHCRLTPNLRRLSCRPWPRQSTSWTNPSSSPMLQTSRAGSPIPRSGATGGLNSISPSPAIAGARGSSGRSPVRWSDQRRSGWSRGGTA